MLFIQIDTAHQENQFKKSSKRLLTIKSHFIQSFKKNILPHKSAKPQAYIKITAIILSKITQIKYYQAFQ